MAKPKAESPPPVQVGVKLLVRLMTTSPNRSKGHGSKERRVGVLLISAPYASVAQLDRVGGFDWVRSTQDSRRLPEG